MKYLKMLNENLSTGSPECDTLDCQQCNSAQKGPGPEKTGGTFCTSCSAQTPRFWRTKHPVPTQCDGCPLLEILNVGGVLLLAGCTRRMADNKNWSSEWTTLNDLNKACLTGNGIIIAEGHGCSSCGSKLYRQIQRGWCCNNCGLFYSIIGGKRGPRLLK